jgi:hypothetical protein
VGVVVVEEWGPTVCLMSNAYVLETVSLIVDLLAAVSTPYLKIIVAFARCINYDCKLMVRV